jgi:hypothetical protein
MNFVVGKRTVPPRVVLYGDSGLGKSTFASGAPFPIFICPEDGTSELEVSRFEEPTKFVDVLKSICFLRDEAHEFRSVVIDSLDWIEPLIWSHVCAENSVDSLEKVGGGYGKGYSAALEVWRELLFSLDEIRKKRQMTIVCIAHAIVKPFNNPDGTNFDRYTMKLNDKACGLVKEWCDALLFAQYKFVVDEDSKTKKGKAYGGSDRVMHAEQRASFHAKNRYGLPASMPLSWDSFDVAMRSRTPDDVVARIEHLLPGIPEAVAATVRGCVAAAKGSIQRLSEIENRLKEITK